MTTFLEICGCIFLGLMLIGICVLAHGLATAISEDEMFNNENKDKDNDNSKNGSADKEADQRTASEAH